MKDQHAYYDNDVVKLNIVSDDLKRLWEKILESEEVPLNENFFLIGGDSFGAVLLLDEMERIFGVTVSVEEFVSDATLVGVIATIAEKLAERVDEQGIVDSSDVSGADSGNPQDHSDSSSSTDRDQYVNRFIEGQVMPLRNDIEGPAAHCLVELRSGQGSPPVFIVHPAGGTVYCYKLLARLLPGSIPVYGLQSPALQPGKPDRISVEEMCEVFIEAIRAVQPTGPYRVLGWSAGGVFAFEIAQQLVKAGETVAHLGLLDTMANFSEVENQTSRLNQLRYVMANIREFGFDNLISGYILDRKVRRRAKNAIRYRSQSQSHQDAVDKIYSRAKGGRNHHVRASRLIVLATNRYVPSLYPGKIYLYCSAMMKSTYQKAAPWEIFWARVAGGGLKIINVPGHHGSVVLPPDVELVAAHIARQLEDKETD